MPSDLPSRHTMLKCRISIDTDTMLNRKVLPGNYIFYCKYVYMKLFIFFCTLYREEKKTAERLESILNETALIFYHDIRALDKREYLMIIRDNFC